MSKDLRWRFWNTVKLFAASQLRKRWMEFHYSDRQCGTCKVWLSETYGVESVRDEEYIQYTKCRNCDQETAWDMRFVIPIYIEEKLKGEKNVR